MANNTAGAWITFRTRSGETSQLFVSAGEAPEGYEAYGHDAVRQVNALVEAKILPREAFILWFEVTEVGFSEQNLGI